MLAIADPPCESGRRRSEPPAEASLVRGPSLEAEGELREPKLPDAGSAGRLSEVDIPRLAPVGVTPVTGVRPPLDMPEGLSESIGPPGTLRPLCRP